MSSAPRDNGEAPMKQAGAPASRADPSPSPAPRGPVAAHAALRMPAALRWALLVLSFLLLLGSTWFASRQAPHPDMFRWVGNWDIGSLDWWRYPLERNAFKRQIVRGNLNAVFLLPGTQKLWAVGEGGLVLHSDDGGATWAQQRPAAQAQDGSPRTKVSAAWPLLPQAVAAEPPDPKAQQTQKAAPQPGVESGPAAPASMPPAATGAQLQATPSKTPATRQAPQKQAAQPNEAAADSSRDSAPRVDTLRADLHTVFFVDDQRGWAVGKAGTILATRDGGNSWAAQASGTTTLLRSVLFAADGQRGWAVGEDGTILATRDGGNSWTAQASGTKASLMSIRFAADDQRGWAVGVGGTILATHDGGRSWTAQASGTKAWLMSVRFAADGQHGWAVGDGGTILATLDGGNSWAAQASGTKAWLMSVRFAADGQHGWAVGDGGTILATRDGGNSWAAQASGTKASLNSVRFATDGQRGWAVGRGGTILATSNGGNSWTAQAGGIEAYLNSVQFVADGQRGWAVGRGGTILTTSNGGSSWTAQASGTEASLTSVQFAADGQRGWAVGDKGIILATRDGGNSWTAQASGTKALLNSVQFDANSQRGWAVGSGGSILPMPFGGTILATRDGGSSWAAQTSGTEAFLNSVQFAGDGQRGWAVGLGGTILATRDGGNSWAAQTSGTKASLTSVQFAADGQRGWAVGDGGAILATSDGGKSWAAQAGGTDAWLTSVQFASDGQRGWAVGDGGTILATSNGGNSWAAQASGTKASLTSVHFTAEDPRHGWAVGNYGTILATRDGGRQWNAIALYQRFWAPWYFAVLALLTLAAFTLLGFVESKRAAGAVDDAAAAIGGAATFLRSDQPVADKALDRLGVRPVVEALSSFIRNRDTEPRVTIAVTGEWGNGKSSVMRMLQTELNHAGFRTAWFNAWHHQQEGKQMSALFNVVRSQAVPQWWRQPLAAWRVRSRLIWGRGWFYKAVAVVTAFVLVLLAGNLLGDGWGMAYERTQANFRHHVLQQKLTAITGASLAKLDPFPKPASTSPTLLAAVKSLSVTDPSTLKTSLVSWIRVAEETPFATDPCDTQPWPPGQSTVPIRPEVYCYIKRDLQWDKGGDTSHCHVKREPSARGSPNCQFAKPEDLLATIEARDVTGARKLLPSERKAIRAAAETVPPPPMFPWLDSAAFGAIAAALALLFTKGFTVYGLQLTAPLRTLLAAPQGKSEGVGKEASGTVERYRTEFRLLCDALDGRLVIFIDDLDRCTPETVNGMLELTNYLTDVGRCFVIIGAAMERVLKCVKSPVGDDPDYPTAYLRKLVHIELPVPQDRTLLDQLAAAPPAAEPRRPGPPRWASRAVGVAVMLGVLCLAFLAGSALHEGSKGEAFEVVAKPVVVTPLPNMDVVEPPPPPPSSVEPQTPGQEVGLVPARAAEMPFAWLGGALLLVLGALGLRWLRRNREQVVVALGGALRSEDSDRFMQALRIWNPVVVSYDPTPRHVKRFYNRARLFAAYEQQQGGESAASDESLVALAAMHHLDPALLASLVDTWTKAGHEARAQDVVNRWLQERASAQGGSQDPPARELRSQALFSAWSQHLKTFDTIPSLDQIRRFARRVEGILVR